MHLTVGGLLLLAVYLIGFVVADYFIIKFIKKRQEMSLKKYYIFSSLTYTILAFLLLFSLMLSIAMLLENSGYGGSAAMPFFEEANAIGYGLLIAPSVQIIFTLCLCGKYIVSVLKKRWQHIFYPFGIGIASFIGIYMIIASFPN